jgi:hypothetical protein
MVSLRLPVDINPQSPACNVIPALQVFGVNDNWRRPLNAGSISQVAEQQ